MITKYREGNNECFIFRQRFIGSNISLAQEVEQLGIRPTLAPICHTYLFLSRCASHPKLGDHMRGSCAGASRAEPHHIRLARHPAYNRSPFICP